MSLFLHEKGYTYFNICDLTYPEINSLVDASNRRARKQEQESKKMARKSKMAGSKGRFRK